MLKTLLDFGANHGWGQFVKITFQDDEIECDVQEIRELLDENKLNRVKLR